MSRKNNKNKVRISLTIDPEIVQIIDKKRGMVPRSAYISNVLDEIRKERKR